MSSQNLAESENGRLCRELMYIRFGKRFVDFFVSGLVLVVLTPVLLIVSIIILFKLGPPILFRQQRPGLEGKAFILLKFRTMIDTRDSQGRFLPDKKRLKRFGRFLRSISIDELPELINVLRGDMSLVGPRPLLMQYLDRYTPEQARRHEIKPGITGWAQVNGRNAVTWEQKFEYDVWYVDHLSFLLDLKIIAFTIWRILKREGINQPGHATMEEYLGTHAKAQRR